MTVTKSLTPMTLPQRRQLSRVYRDGLVNESLVAGLDRETVQRALAKGAELQQEQIDVIRRLGQIKTERTVRVAIQIELLAELQAAGVPLWGGSPTKASYGNANAQVEFEVPLLDLDAIFAARDRAEPPWNRTKIEQIAWGKGSIQPVVGTIQAVVDYAKANGHVPDPERYWTLRCSDALDAGRSLCVDWGPRDGFGVDWGRDVDAYPNVGALPGSP